MPALRRGTLSTAACGVCGRRTIDDLVARCTPLDDDTRFSRSGACASSPARLRSEQVNFQKSGGLHAAGLATPEGRFLFVREDVGRHNAVDKLIGRLLLDDALPASGRALVVSGRTSFEIVQKALAARIPLVLGVSAPSSLAVATAERARMTLVGFARGQRFQRLRRLRARGRVDARSCSKCDALAFDVQWRGCRDRAAFAARSEPPVKEPVNGHAVSLDGACESGFSRFILGTKSRTSSRVGAW